MYSSFETFINSLHLAWAKYSPEAEKALHILETETKSKFHLDHVAFRTLDVGVLRLDRLDSIIKDAGYLETGSYYFKDKHVRAKSYAHLLSGAPKLFVSELILEEMPQAVRDICVNRALSIKPLADRNWTNTFSHIWYTNKLSQTEIEILRETSEYALWTCLHGLRPNHFAYDVTSIGGVAKALDILEGKGFKVNDSKGRIQGGTNTNLEQGSLMSEHRLYPSQDGVFAVGYIEFVRRFIDPKTGKLFDKFVEGQANNIFLSTYKK
jgi:hypothetical protein